MQSRNLNKTHLLWMLLLCVTFSHFGSDLYVPSLPAMAKEFQDPNIASTLTAYFLGMGFSQFFFGPYSDRFGRKSMLLCGLIIFLLATLICIFAPSTEWLHAGRILQGLGIGAANVLGRAIVRDAYAIHELTRTMSYISSTWSLTPLIVPVIGSYIQAGLGWRYNFVFLFLYVGFSTLLFVRWLPETLHTKDLEATKLKVMLRNYGRLFSHSSYVGNVLCAIIIVGPILAFPAFAPFLLQDHWHVSAVSFGWLVLLIASGYMVSTFLCARLSSLIKQQTLVMISLLIYFTIVLFMVILSLWSISLSEFVILMFLVFFSLGFIFPICISSALLPFAKQTGTASGLIGSLSMLTGALVTMIVSYMPKSSALPLAIFLLVDAVLLAIAFFSLANRTVKNRG